MYVNTEAREITSFGHSERSSFSIAANAKAFKVLVDGLYTNKIYAVVRELMTNGYDSHCKAGIPRVPIEVKAPNMLEPSFSVRDFGVGMSHDFVMKLYSTVFYSTKEDSNTEVGKFGLGSKSPFAYTDTFSVTTFDGQNSHSYTAYLEQDGKPCIVLNGVTPSSEPRGSLVTVPVKSLDYRAFVKYCAIMSRAFDIQPDFKNTVTVIDAPEITHKGNGWKLYSTFDITSEISAGNALVRQGCVFYPVTGLDLSNIDSEKVKTIVNLDNLIIDFDVGMLDIVASREALSFDKNTQSNIVKRFEQVYEEMAEQIYADILLEKSSWQTIKNLRNKFYGSSLLNSFKGSAVFRDKLETVNSFNYKKTRRTSNLSHLSTRPSLATFEATFRFAFPNTFLDYEILYKNVTRINTPETVVKGSFETVGTCDVEPWATQIFVNFQKDKNKGALRRAAVKARRIYRDDDERLSRFYFITVPEGKEAAFYRGMISMGRAPFTDVKTLPELPKAVKGTSSSPIPRAPVSLKRINSHYSTSNVTLSADDQTKPIYYVHAVRSEIVVEWPKDKKDTPQEVPLRAAYEGFTLLKNMKIIPGDAILVMVNSSIKKSIGPSWTNLLTALQKARGEHDLRAETFFKDLDPVIDSLFPGHAIKKDFNTWHILGDQAKIEVAGGIHSDTMFSPYFERMAKLEESLYKLRHYLVLTDYFAAFSQTFGASKTSTTRAVANTVFEELLENAKALQDERDNLKTYKENNRTLYAMFDGQHLSDYLGVLKIARINYLLELEAKNACTTDDTNV